jgi:phosphatidylglycerophosphate synthase
MTLYKRREIFSDLSIKIGIAFSRLKISPNQWTLISLLPVIAAVWLLYNSQFVAAAVLFIVSAFLDMVDGSVARVTGRSSILGAYLDTIVDRYVEFLIVLGLLLAALPGFMVPAYIWIALYLFGSLMTTYAKAAAKEKGLSKFELKGGLLERAERLIILFVGILLAAINPLYLTYVLAILAVLTNVSAIQRIWIAVCRANDS